MINQMEMFEMLDTRKEFIIYGKFAIKRKCGWQEFIATDLIRKGNYTFDVNSLKPEFMEEQDLVMLGYTVVTPDINLYHDKIVKHLTFKASSSCSVEKFPSIFVEINL